MTTRAIRPDVRAVLGSLKDFQRQSVDYIFSRLYQDADHTRRFLLADEVGLGKTLVAKGVIARAIDHLWEQVARIDIVYICSNADIARQNINRLNVSGQSDLELASRITLLPITLRDLKNNRVNFVSFTPATSFSLQSTLGTATERALLYWLLREIWNLRGAGPMNVLQGNARTENFRERIRTFRNEHEIDESLAEAFAKAIGHQVAAEQHDNRPDLRARFEGLCDRFTRSRGYIPADDVDDRRQLIGELRALLADTCLQALQPDMIILDEFQRFKHLLDGEDEASQLARRLFEYADDTSSARVLLLSATPYRMYTAADELGDEDHYQDFIRTLRFLLDDQSETDEIAALLHEYRRGLLRLTDGSTGKLGELKRDLEKRLRRVMVRTERLAVSHDRSGMLVETPVTGALLQPRDLEAFVGLEKVARRLDQGSTLEYWKSAPYLLNFMDDYELKASFEDALKDPDQHAELARELADEPSVLLSWHDIRAYAEIDPGNSRLRALLADTIGMGAWRLLWVPPALPYHRPEGPFDGPTVRGFTKRLVFSSWLVVPKVISAILSYEAERRMMSSFEDAPENTSEARRRRSPLLRFGRDADDRLTGMAVLGLIYPSFTLARLGDPLAFIRERGDIGRLPTVTDMTEWASHRIARLLPAIGANRATRPGPPDEAWYWAAPILLDLSDDPAAAQSWLGRSGLAPIWADIGETTDAEEPEDTIWAEHVERAQSLADGELQLGRPPDDLVTVLAQMAVAGPAMAAMRALSRVMRSPSSLVQDWLRDDAANVAWAFRNLFNLPETMALVRGLNREEPYWRRVLEYCLAGGLQAVLDEYVHMLQDLLGVRGSPPKEASCEIADEVVIALKLRTSTMRVDEISVDPESQRVEISRQGMRGRFALRYGDERADDGAEVTRSDHVRAAFNSPFWPFVVATTSVGQEGLDFHPYCHAVVHWNLPSNPVDLEQREGRIHRYKGHAVRRNLGLHYGTSPLSAGDDPWEGLFERAVRDRAQGVSDLVPFWVYQVDGGAKIERHVPALPMSRDADRLAALRRALVVYRMVFGQPRQEDLMVYLLSHLPAAEVAAMIGDLRIDLSPPDG